jgi:type II secretory pathway pseudopilin PulG
MQLPATFIQRNRRQRLQSTRRMNGFTFLGLMMIIALLGIALLAVGEVWHFAGKRAKEQELLFIGNQFRQAIKLYCNHAPPANKLQPFPMSLEDLIKDPRYPSTQRYLRKIYTDPITGGSEWGILTNPNGAIIGVFSLSTEEPVKKGNFKLSEKDFEGKTQYADWHFIYVPAVNPAKAAPTP